MRVTVHSPFAHENGGSGAGSADADGADAEARAEDAAGGAFFVASFEQPSETSAATSANAAYGAWTQGRFTRRILCLNWSTRGAYRPEMQRSC